jgi:hypothetical protein
MSGTLKVISLLGFAILILIIALTIYSLTGGFEHSLSNPPT